MQGAQVVNTRAEPCSEALWYARQVGGCANIAVQANLEPEEDNREESLALVCA